MSEQKLPNKCLAARGIAAYQMLAHEGSVPDGQLEWQNLHMEDCEECRVAIAQMITAPSTPTPIDCISACRLMSTLANCGKELMPTSMQELRAHWATCTSCKRVAYGFGLDNYM